MDNCDNQIVIRFAGDSGDGMQIVGEQLTITAAVSGKDVRTYPEFPAEIRAPAGTVAGISGFQLAMAEQAIFTAGEELDILVALNPAALSTSLSSLKDGGLLIFNEESFTDKDWIKAKLDKNTWLDKLETYQLISLPLIRLTNSALETIKINHATARKAKNFYILGIVLWIFDLPIQPCLEFIAKKFKLKEQIEKINTLALKAGYNYALTLELSRQKYKIGKVKRGKGKYRQITGVEAAALACASLAVNTKISLLVSGYPITPASAILQECARLKDFGVHLFQAEDEIAALCACIGAAYGGNLALSCTSGPGFDLKTESLGLAVMAELPLVLVNVQRAGASTGLPTKTSQSDLLPAIFGRHGEAPIPVLAAKSPANCFTIIIEAFTIAIEFMTPVIVLLDAYLANAAESWRIPKLKEINIPEIIYNQSSKPYQRNHNNSRPWIKPGTKDLINQIGGLEKQGIEGKVSYDDANHQAMVELRAKKISNIAKSYSPLIIEGVKTASTLIVGWGSTYGAIKNSLKDLAQENIMLAHLHLTNIFPLPTSLGQILTSYQKVIVIELNSGHLEFLLRATFLIRTSAINQINGKPFATKFLTQAIKTRLKEK